MIEGRITKDTFGVNLVLCEEREKVAGNPYWIFYLPCLN
jgi:hypothetical protein